MTRRGYLPLQEPPYWPALANQRAALFGLSDAGGYNPTQLIGYWKFVRLANPKRVRYNASYLSEVPPVVRDLLGIGWAIAPIGTDVPGAGPVGRDGSFELSRFDGPPGLASFHERFVVVGSADEALRRAASASDGEVLFLERSPSLGEGGAAGAPMLSVRWLSTSEVVIDSLTRRPGIVLLSVPYDRNWREADDQGILRVDGFLMGFATSGSVHSWHLRYDDPTIGYGLLGSGLAVGALLATAGWLAARSRRRRRRDGAPGEQEPADEG